MDNQPKKAQQQAVRKCRQTVAAAPSIAGYEPHGALHGFRAIHSSRYRIFWRVLRPASGVGVAEVCYFGKRAEGDEEDAYNEFEYVRLDLVESRTFGSRVIYERYGRARDESD